MSFVEVGKDGFAVGFFFWVCLTATVELDKFLDAVVTAADNVAAVEDGFIFGMDFFEEVVYFGG